MHDYLSGELECLEELVTNVKGWKVLCANLGVTHLSPSFVGRIFLAPAAGAQDWHVSASLAFSEVDWVSGVFQGGSCPLLVRSQGSGRALTRSFHPAG